MLPGQHCFYFFQDTHNQIPLFFPNFLHCICNNLKGISPMYCNVIVFELTVHFGWNFYHVPSLLPHSCYSFVFHSSFFSEISLNNLFKHELPSAIKTLHFPTSFLFLQHLLYPHPMHEHSVFTHTHTHTNTEFVFIL